LRGQAKDGPLLVQAIAGTNVVLLAMDLQQRYTNGVLGFGIERTDHTAKNHKDWLTGFRTFREVEVADPKRAPTNKHPIQAFLWGDYTATRGHEYTYRIVVMREPKENPVESEEVSIRLTMDREDVGTHEVYFNMGVAASQAYINRFENKRPSQVGRKAYEWLSRGLEEALISFVRQATGTDWSIHAAVYEFSHEPILREFKNAIDRGVTVKIIFDSRKEGKFDKENNPIGPWKMNRDALKNANIADEFTTPRTKSPSYISHNKFIILLKNGNPQQVWTGSTNITLGGIFGHSNVGHIVRDQHVAALYEMYWNQLQEDPEAKDLRLWTESNSVVPTGAPPPNSITPIFSPRGSLKALQWYASRMEEANIAIFLTAAFGVNDLFEKVFDSDKNNLRYLILESEDNNMEKLTRYKFNRVVIGDRIARNLFEHWLEEQLSGLNKHVKWVHTKYMLIDPLSEDPIVITGSANFSDSSVRNNDENMLVIRGDTHVADIYLTEFMRLYRHFEFRNAEKGLGLASPSQISAHLADDDEWLKPYYQADQPEYKERLYFTRQNPFPTDLRVYR
jgi:phosphatidylserine/phosphatidylglycerophosphate/cardiolipin synthase-like enzyme